MAGQICLNLICPTTPRSLVNWLSGSPPAPTIHYAKKHLEGIQEGYSCLAADTIIAGAAVPLSLSASFVAQAISIEIPDPVLPSKKGCKVGMTLSLLFLMNETPMTRVTLVVSVSTQQARPAPVGVAARLS